MQQINNIDQGDLCNPQMGLFTSEDDCISKCGKIAQQVKDIYTC